VPSSAPSFDLDYEFQDTYIDYQATLEQYAAVEDSFTFSTFFYKGLTVVGQCEDWTQFTDKALELPFDDVRFSRISGRFDRHNFATGASKSITAVCEDPKVVKGIIASLKSGAFYE
ncbi:hypothetical protein B484DRAFT_436787, partial [Ochromonadaceae sp. CCMP2298]